MNFYQIVELILVAVFCIAYLSKMFSQKKQGIQTTQLGKKSSSKQTKDKKTLQVEKFVSLMSCVIIIAISVSVFTDWCYIKNDVLRTAGLVVTALGCLTFIMGMVTLSDSWRAGIPAEDKTKFVHTGIYKISRNPAFLGFDMLYIGTAIVFSNILLTVAVILAIISLHMLILEEERFLSKRFGNEYLEYKKSVARYILIF